MLRSPARLKLCLWLCALWPIWHWYLMRTFDGADDPWGILALVALLSLRLRVHLDDRTMYTALLASIVGLPFPPLLRAALVCLCLGQSLPPGGAGLLLLSLPLVASLNFYGGYPLRWVAGGLAALTMQAAGRSVSVHGLQIAAGGAPVLLDAPCSGIESWWWLLFVACLLSAWRRLPVRPTLALVGLATVLAVLGNSWRIVALLFAGPCSETIHSGIGLVIFAAMGTTLVVTAAAFKTGAADSPLSPSMAPVRWPFIAACLLAACAWRPLSATAPISIASSGADFVIRRVTEATRQLHPAADCYHATGYSIHPEPALAHDGRLWSCFTAERGGQSLHVQQSIWDEHGQSWSDVSQWYWAAILGQTTGPWTTETIQNL